jgi:phosphatidate cytidylyltransferase
MICPKVPTDSFWVTLQCVPDPVFVSTSYEIPAFLGSVLAQAGFHQATITILPVQLHAIVFALFASLIAPFGGFFASGIKRAYRVKDFDSLFPGHGGMTDRMDCQFIMGLFTYVYMSTFIHSATLSAAQVLQSIMVLPIEEQRQIFEQLKQVLAN